MPAVFPMFINDSFARAYSVVMNITWTEAYKELCNSATEQGHMMDSVIIPILQHQGLLDYYDNCIAPEADSRIKASIDKFDKLSYEINDINSLNVAIFNMISFD